MSVPKMRMNNGVEIPQVGLGLWRIFDRDECIQAVRWGLDAGYRHFDTAQLYENEEFLSEAIKDSSIDRKEVFITTKIYNGNQAERYLLPSFEESLDKLKSGYVDLLLLHFPVSETRRRAWEILEEIYGSGRAKSIGVSNYTIRHLEELLRECSVKPAVNQVELHVFLQQPELVEYCKKNGIVIEAYCPLVRGRGMDNTFLQKIAKKHNKTVAQIMIRWCIEGGTVPLPKSVHKERIEENIDVFDFSLDADDLKEIATLDENYRIAWDPSDVE